MPSYYDEVEVTVEPYEIVWETTYGWNSIVTVPGVDASTVTQGGTGVSVLKDESDLSYMPVFVHYDATGNVDADAIPVVTFDPIAIPAGARITSLSFNYRARRMQTLPTITGWTPDPATEAKTFPFYSMELVQWVDGAGQKLFLTRPEYEIEKANFSYSWPAGKYYLHATNDWQDYHANWINREGDFLPVTHPNYHVYTKSYNQFDDYFWDDANFRFMSTNPDGNFIEGVRQGTVGVILFPDHYGSNANDPSVEGIDVSRITMTVRYTLDEAARFTKSEFAKILGSTAPGAANLSASGFFMVKVAENRALATWWDTSSGDQRGYASLITVDPVTMAVTATPKLMLGNVYCGDVQQPFQIHENIVIIPMRPSGVGEPRLATVKIDGDSLVLVGTTVDGNVGFGSGFGDPSRGRGALVPYETSSQVKWFTTDGVTVTETNTSVSGADRENLGAQLRYGYVLFGESTLVTGYGTVYSVDWVAKTFTLLRTLSRPDVTDNEIGGIIKAGNNSVDLWYEATGDRLRVAMSIPITGGTTPATVIVGHSVGLYGNDYEFRKPDSVVRGPDGAYYSLAWSSTNSRYYHKSYPPLYGTVNHKFISATYDENFKGITNGMLGMSMIKVSDNIALAFRNTTDYFLFEALPIAQDAFDGLAYPNGLPSGPLWYTEPVTP